MINLDELFAAPANLTRWQRVRLWIRRRLWWSQCQGRHMPYANMTEEECRNSIVCSNNANGKTFFCIRKRWHIGRCRDVHGARFDK